MRCKLTRPRHLVVEAVDVSEGRDDEHVGHLLGGDRRVVDEGEEARVDAAGGVVAGGARRRQLALVDPAATQVVVPLVPRAPCALRPWPHVVRPRELLQEAVPHAVELVAEAPDEQRGVGGVLRHLVPEVGDDLLPLRRCLHGRLGGVAHVEGRHQVKAVGCDGVQEVGVVVLKQPAINAQNVRAHGLDQREVPQPDEAVV
mmetsp:Transcript_11186/g.25050  ORF Transcript_11186/g.25050 Transcript_11186/m.25050 type:complete len:201 (+) Transcript_11186:1265-1867(+)